MFLKAQLKENRDVRDYIANKLVDSGYILRDANDCYDSKLAMDTELLIKKHSLMRLLSSVKSIKLMLIKL